MIFPFIGVKSGRKKGRNNTTVPKPQKLSNGNICVEFTCVPIKECTIPKCPPNFVLHTVHKKNNIKLNCPIYSCVPPAPPHATCNITGRTFHTFDGTEFKHDVCNHILAGDLTNDNWDISGKIVLIVKFRKCQYLQEYHISGNGVFSVFQCTRSVTKSLKFADGILLLYKMKMRSNSIQI